MTWPKTDIIHRVHPEAYDADVFNPGPRGNARFSPILDIRGKSIPTIYGGETFDCAAMETVYHDVPFAPGLKSVAKRKLRGHLYSQLASSSALTLADLRVTALRKLGVTRAQLIDTEKDRYPYTRSWAEAIHAQCADVQGLCWVSRQDDRALAIILFGDRIDSGLLSPLTPSLDIVNDPAIFAEIVALADRIGVKLIGR
ncbi:RES family NAD+ phosphorylase [Sphingopyxis sp. P1IMeth2]|uniref:RES family NAD+ phosphorylase n=1 Tax=Sphingopyxis sp. P1IMeth2 TaxID=1892848 RepID=UPI0021B2F62A|nr:RES family NAD+ phosphorylase [Sphingopyxis sp. P1IMeth2]